MPRLSESHPYTASTFSFGILAHLALTHAVRAPRVISQWTLRTAGLTARLVALPQGRGLAPAVRLRAIRGMEGVGLCWRILLVAPLYADAPDQEDEHHESHLRDGVHIRPSFSLGC